MEKEPEHQPEETEQRVATTKHEEEDYTVPTILLPYMNTKCKAEANFLDNIYDYFKAQLLYNIKAKPFNAVKTWYQKHTECTVTIKNWGELLKLISITALEFPEWEPATLAGLDIPKLVRQMHMAYDDGHGIDYVALANDQDDDPEKPAPPHLFNSSTTDAQLTQFSL